MKNSIVTKTGDAGETFLLAGVRIPKNNIRVKSYGESDELNSILGIVQSSIQNDEINGIIKTVQSQLFELSVILATPLKAIKPETDKNNTTMIDRYITFLEAKIDKLEPTLPELRNFILPGGIIGASYLHLARTVCRRVERTILDLNDFERVNSRILVYFNRLSDLLFILARYFNMVSNVQENIWISEKY